ncbi:MAG: extracellular solute-binding protein [Patescibacteria group bacterium]|nr:extracellular solute-binding protein [Patescibacteria group bacterium]
MKLSRRQAILLLGAVVFIGALIVLFYLNARPKPNNAASIKLSAWGTEDKAALMNVFGAYPYATISYTQLDPATYDQTLLNALAAGTGPDIFEISNRSLPRWKSVLAPMPADYAQQFNALQMQNDFPDVVANDFELPTSDLRGVPGAGSSSLYALPLSIDTLAMFYNKDLFNSANITYPPKTWDDVQADIMKLRLLNAQGQVTRAGAALGGSETSIPNAPDLLSLLMLQNGTQMVSGDFSSAQFASGGANGAGQNAFDFYLQFANPTFQDYTWNDQMGAAIDNFAAGNAAIIFGYQSDMATIRQKAPYLNFGVAAMPQPSNATIAINYPKYEGFAVAKASPQAAVAWNAILYLTTNNAIEKMYVSATGKPPALRQEIQADMNDPNLSIFASQALTAKSWYQANDEEINAIFNEAIQKVLGGQADSVTALGQAQAAVNALMR